MSNPVIQVQNLTRRFGDLIAVDGVSFEVKKGEVYSLLGPNGAGKSTLIRMLTTLLHPASGTARICGYDIIKESHKVRQHIGLVAEKLILYERLTAEENLRLFGRLNHMSKDNINERIDYLLGLMQMGEWRHQLTGTFSSGMKQRINIARALIHSPEVLFLDEPTLGLDPQTTRSLHDLTHELKEKGMTIFLTTHIMPEAEALSDRIAIIDHGKIVAAGTPVELKKSLVGEDTRILDIGIGRPSDGLEQELSSLEGVSSVSAAQPLRLRISTSDDGTIYKVIETVKRHRVEIIGINTLGPTLEDVFLQLTGREVRDATQGKAPSGRVNHRARRASKRIR